MYKQLRKHQPYEDVIADGVAEPPPPSQFLTPADPPTESSMAGARDWMHVAQILQRYEAQEVSNSAT